VLELFKTGCVSVLLVIRFLITDFQYFFPSFKVDDYNPGLGNFLINVNIYIIKSCFLSNVTEATSQNIV